jgi:hypothetical protein
MITVYFAPPLVKNIEEANVDHFDVAQECLNEPGM